VRPVATRSTAEGQLPGASHDGIGIFQQSNGLEFLRNQLSSGFADYTMLYGNPGDLPIVGDWTGNGTDSPGMYRPSTQSFYLVSDEMCNCSLYSDYNFQLSHGSNNYPVAGDWLGDGYSSIGLYNTNNPYSFIIRKAIGDSTINYNLGPLPSAQPGDLPVAGHWLAVCAQLPNRIQSGRIPTCAQATVAPGTCPITINALNYFRIAPALDDRSTIDPNGENWLFSINAGNSVAFPTTARPWLWAFNPVTNGQVPYQADNSVN